MSRDGYFGPYGGRYVAEVLRQPLEELEAAFVSAMADPAFLQAFERFAHTYTGRPTPLLFAENATREIGGADIYVKIEGLANTGAHKINNAAGQALLARRMGKTRIIAETGAGQHGVATAAACARLGLECVVYMGEEDIRRQRPNVYWMELFGAEVRPVSSGTRTLKDAVNAALRDWAGSWQATHYLLGSALGPAPFPDMVREFQAVIGRETREQLAALRPDAPSPDALVACVGGGSNAIGFFEPWLPEEEAKDDDAMEDGVSGSGGGSGVAGSGRGSAPDGKSAPESAHGANVSADAALTPPLLVGAEAGGRGSGPGENAVRMAGVGRVGVVQGYRSRFLTDQDGQVLATHSISAGLDYAGIGPQLAHLGESGHVRFVGISDDRALEALRFYARTEGLIFAMESAHGGAAALDVARELGRGKCVVVNMSGRGDKDIFISAAALDGDAWRSFLESESKGEEGR